jgi:small GTP-binding protein
MSTQQNKTQTTKQNTNNNYLDNNSNLITKYFNKIQNKIEPNISHKVVIIGDANLGKTCLITRFKHNKFDTTAPTIGAIHHIKTAENISLDIWDTAGQERFKSMIPMYYKGASALIICFDITNPDSFEGAQNWHTEIFESVKKVIIVLCGTKRDLEQKGLVDYRKLKNLGIEMGLNILKLRRKII